MTRPTHFSIIGTTEVGRRVLPRTTVSRERACTTPASAAWWGMMPYRLFARFQPKGRPARLRRMPESFHPEKTRSALHANSSASNPYWCGSELTIAVSTAAYHSEPLTSRFTSSTSWPSSTVVMTTLRISRSPATVAISTREQISLRLTRIPAMSSHFSDPATRSGDSTSFFGDRRSSASHLPAVRRPGSCT
jgi:hypothetical protein